jgi:hypothetical protein
VNLAFNGNGHQTIGVAKQLVQIEAAAFVIDCEWNMKAAEISSNAAPLVRYLRANGSAALAPIVLVEGTRDGTAWLLPGMAAQQAAKQAALRAAYNTLMAEGVQNLYYVNMSDLSDPVLDGTVCGVHSADYGTYNIAKFYAQFLPSILQDRPTAMKVDDIEAAAVEAACPNRCSLNGRCAEREDTRSSGGACVFPFRDCHCQCLPGWTGAQCSFLKQGMSTRAWPSLPKDQDASCYAASWGAGLVPPVVGVSDKWDLFVDSICLRNPHNSSEKLGCSHTRNSQIVHATSSSAEGPYTFSDVAVPPSVNNPAAVYHAQEKLYLLVSIMLLMLLLLPPPPPPPHCCCSCC